MCQYQKLKKGIAVCLVTVQICGGCILPAPAENHLVPAGTEQTAAEEPSRQEREEKGSSEGSQPEGAASYTKGMPETEADIKAESVEIPQWTLEECLRLFDMLEPSVWGFYWDVYENDLRLALTAEDFERVRAYVETGQAEETAAGKEYICDRNAAQEAFAVQNQLREEAGLPVLQWSEEVYGLAVERVGQIAEDFSHAGRPEGYGENLASGPAGDGGLILERWYGSEDHRANILNETYTMGAIACANGLWVALFR